MTLILWDKGSIKWHNQQTDLSATAYLILKNLWEKYYDKKGISYPEKHKEYEQYWSNHIVLPKNIKKIMPWGKTIDGDTYFSESRPDYKDLLPPKGPYNEKNSPVYNYHRTWEQCEFAIALAYIYLFDSDADTQITLQKQN